MKKTVSCSEFPSLWIAGCLGRVERLCQCLLFCAHHLTWTSTPALRKPWLPQDHREEIWPQDMGHCPEPGHKKCQFAAHPAWGRFALIVVLFFTNLNRKGNALIRLLGMLHIAYCLLLSVSSWRHALSKSYPEWGPRLMPLWTVSLTRHCASHGLSARLS